MGGAEKAVVRGWRERAIQALAYEAGGLALFAPLWALATGASVAHRAGQPVARRDGLGLQHAVRPRRSPAHP